MRWLALLLAALAAYSVAAAEARADVVGTARITGPTTAAIARDGQAAAAIATTFSATDVSDQRVILVSRGSGAWREQDLSASAAFVRDAQVAVNVNGTLVAAWAQYTKARGEELLVASGPAGATVRVVARVRVGRASSATPRLATLNDRRILLAWRDGSTVRAAPVLGDRLGPAHVVASGAGTFALAATASSAQLAWLDRSSGQSARVLRTVRLREDATLLTRPLLVSHNASGSIRVAGDAEPRAIVSWLRPGTRPSAYTRQVAPFTRPARPVVAPESAIALAPAAVSLADDASAALTLRVGAAIGVPFRIAAANSQSGGVWTRMALLSPGSPMNGSPQAVALGGRRSLAIWADAHPAVGPATYDVHVVARDATGNTTASETLPTPYDHTDGGGLAVAHAGTRTLIAYGAPDGGFAVVERTG